jgi:hypothetical protein
MDIPNKDITEIFERNAWLTGGLTSMGIVPTALVPLFYNRVQKTRRNDAGVYLWEQGERLDQWLNSCRYPNFSLSAIRDFEHLILIENTKHLHHYIGTHILSFILVLGSYFGNKHPGEKGINENGRPFDARYLFDAHLFSLIVKSVIEEMGMDEMLRVNDQNRMDEQKFSEFFSSKGYGPKKIANLKKSKQDITLHTEPHLGGFNQGISVPKLIEFLFRQGIFQTAS